MKTAKEWFEQLPEPIRTQAVDTWEFAPSSAKNKIFESIINPLLILSIGSTFWKTVLKKYINGEFDKPIPNLHGWIPVGERLPTAKDADEFGSVLALLTPNRHPMKMIAEWASLQDAPKETMWQPLPKLPEVKNGK